LPKSSKSKKSKKSSSKKKEEAYVDSIDLRSWWEKFSTEINDNGTPKYKTVWAFIIARTKVQWQRDLLYWMLGPKVEDVDKAASPYKEFDQFDWADKKEKGFWFSSTNIEKLSQNLSQKQHAMAKLAELGEVNLEFIGQIREIAKQIQREFGGQLFLPNAKFKENRLRVDLFMQLQKQVLDLAEQAQKMYGRTQGLDISALNQFLAMFGQGMGQSAGLGRMLGLMGSANDSDNSSEKQYSKTLTALLEMSTTKAAELDIPLPDNDMAHVIQAQNQKPSLVRRNGKASVQ
jgi:hypothetical protein